MLKNGKLLSAVCFLLAVSLPSCSTQHPQNPKQFVEAKIPWSFTYRDGSGNRTRFWRESAGSDAQFAYAPITPEMSSSGVYSGGSPKQGVLDEAQVLELWQWIEKLASDTTIQADSRMKGTGAFRIETGDETVSFVVKRGSMLQAFHTSIAPYRGD